ncbi:protein of unknown function [Methylocella tundrae]|uniref:Uncharacterized protein n=1 Tax=Methylocella tundrae TaxID=227605 RepID=A0A4U8YYQ1_METTU|nr:protein of unknown function [Methylocella tundrae]
MAQKRRGRAPASDENRSSLKGWRAEQDGTPQRLRLTSGYEPPNFMSAKPEEELGEREPGQEPLFGSGFALFQTVVWNRDAKAQSECRRWRVASLVLRL